MTFDKAMDLVLSMYQPRWTKRYDPNPLYIFLGCEGRFMRRKCWAEDTYITSSRIFGTLPGCKSMKNDIVCINMSNDDLVFFDDEDVSDDDWEVWDFIPSGKTKVNPEGNLYGHWSQKRHMFEYNPKTNQIEETPILLED